MKTLFKFGLAAAVTYVLVDALFKRLGADSDDDESWEQDFTDAAYPPSSIDEIPTLHAVRDAEPQLSEPLREDDLNVAQNSPL